jgi:hypothetical protein
VNRRNQTEHNSCQERDGKRKTEHLAVDSHFAHPGDIVRRERHKRISTPKGKQQSQTTACNREYDAFGQQQTQYAQTTSP